MVKQGFTHVPQRSKLMFAQPPSLVDLCVQTAIDNVRYLGDVGETDLLLLERILPHCNVEQLRRVENETKERDLSQVTNKLWKKFYEVKFGAEHTNEVIEKLKRSKQKFTWKQLYEAKLEVQDKAQKQSLERLTQLYRKEDESEPLYIPLLRPRRLMCTVKSAGGLSPVGAVFTSRKQSRQIQFCSKAPPSAKRRFFGGGYGAGSSISNVKSNIMKKAKIEYRLACVHYPRPCSDERGCVYIVPSMSKPGMSAYKPGSSQFKESSSTHRDMRSPRSIEPRQGSLQLKASASDLVSASTSRYTKTEREGDANRNPGTSKGKAISLPGKNSAVAPRKTKINWDDDIKRKLDEFW
ncbi:hypothetical protein V2J09_000037 [Rumex salicifolius]